MKVLQLRRNVGLWILVCLMILALGLPVTAQAKKEEIVVWLFGSHFGDANPLHESWFENIAELFEQENPGYTVSIHPSSANTTQRLLASIASGTDIPDVVMLLYADARGLYEQGALLELNEFIDRTPHMAMDNFLPTARRMVQKEGKIYGMPWTFEAHPHAFRMDYANESGLDTNPEAWATWDDLVRYAQLMTRLDGSGNVTRAGFAGAHEGQGMGDESLYPVALAQWRSIHGRRGSSVQQ